ncbi:MAG: bifunctional pyr operon transcriptional regulator/uracil phosphoribosyltransferase PyrR [Bacteroidia bacterium]
MNKKTILEKKQFAITIDRLCFQILERHNNLENTAIVGLQPRGVYLSRRIKTRLSEITGKTLITYGEIDASFYRDDFRRNEEPILPHTIAINFDVEGKKIILIDDVLYTGRTVRSALEALLDFGRPVLVELLVLIDRRYSRHVPIQPDYVGLTVDTRTSDKVVVEWKETSKNDMATIVNKNN